MRNLGITLLLGILSIQTLAQVPEDGFSGGAAPNPKLISGSKFTFYDIEGNFLPGVGFIFYYILEQPKENLSYSVGSIPGLAASFSNIGSFVHLDLPLLAQLNLGAGSDPYSDAPIGLVVSAGLGNNFIHYIGLNEYSYGPMIDVGLRVNVYNRIYQLSGSYMQNLNQNRLIMGPSIVNVGFGTIF